MSETTQVQKPDAEAQLVVQLIEVLRKYKTARSALRGAVTALKATEEFITYQVAMKVLRASKRSLDETVDTLKV